jgi:hypothetical protein
MSRILAIGSILVLAAAPVAAHDWNGLALDAAGNAYVVDADDGRIWKVAGDGKATTFIGGADGERLAHPHHVELDERGFLWLAAG